jgi:hypothetical protein
MKTDTNDTTNLLHARGCPAARIETTEHPDVTTEHCLDCGAHWPPAPHITGALGGRTVDPTGGVTMEPAQ